MNKFILTVKQYIGWIVGTGYGWIVSFEHLAQSFLTIVTACMITVATFFINRFLNKRFPKQSTPKKPE